MRARGGGLGGRGGARGESAAAPPPWQLVSPGERRAAGALSTWRPQLVAHTKHGRGEGRASRGGGVLPVGVVYIGGTGGAWKQRDGRRVWALVASGWVAC